VRPERNENPVRLPPLSTGSDLSTGWGGDTLLLLMVLSTIYETYKYQEGSVKDRICFTLVGLIVVACLWSAISGCTSDYSSRSLPPTYTLYPTYTPYPTPTSTPTHPPTPHWSPPTGECLHWTEAGRHIGEATCVCGVVTHTHDSGKAFFINFTSDRSAFYGVSFDYTWDDLEGQCICLSGLVGTYNGQAQIIIRTPNQVDSCD